MIALEELLEPLVELQSDKLSATVRRAVLLLAGHLDLVGPAAVLVWSGSGAGVLVDAGAVVVDVGVELHVARHLHPLPQEHLLNALPQVALSKSTQSITSSVSKK